MKLMSNLRVDEISKFRYLKIDEIDLTIKRLIELVVAETELYLEEMEKFVKKGCK